MDVSHLSGLRNLLHKAICMTRCIWKITLDSWWEDKLLKKLYNWLNTMVDDYEWLMQDASAPHRLTWEHEDSMWVTWHRPRLQVDLENPTWQALILQDWRKWWQLPWYFPNLDGMAQMVTKNVNATYDWSSLEVQRKSRSAWYTIWTAWIKPRELYTRTLLSNNSRLKNKFIQWFQSW